MTETNTPIYTWDIEENYLRKMLRVNTKEYMKFPLLTILMSIISIFLLVEEGIYLFLIVMALIVIAIPAFVFATWNGAVFIPLVVYRFIRKRCWLNDVMSAYPLREDGAYGKASVSFVGNGIEISFFDKNEYIAYSDIRKIKRKGEYIAIYFLNNDVLLIPNESFNPTALAMKQLNDMCQKQCIKKYNSLPRDYQKLCYEAVEPLTMVKKLLTYAFVIALSLVMAYLPNAVAYAHTRSISNLILAIILCLVVFCVATCIKRVLPDMDDKWKMNSEENMNKEESDMTNTTTWNEETRTLSFRPTLQYNYLFAFSQNKKDYIKRLFVLFKKATIAFLCMEILVVADILLTYDMSVSMVIYLLFSLIAPHAHITHTYGMAGFVSPVMYVWATIIYSIIILSMYLRIHAKAEVFKKGIYNDEDASIHLSDESIIWNLNGIIKTVSYAEVTKVKRWKKEWFVCTEDGVYPLPGDDKEICDMIRGMIAETKKKVKNKQINN